MGAIRIVSRKSADERIFSCMLKGIGITEEDLIPYQKGDKFTIQTKISEESADYLANQNYKGVNIWNYPVGDDEMLEYSVVLEFIIIEREHLLSADLTGYQNQEMLPLSNTIVLSPATEDVETVLRWLRELILPSDEDEMPF